MSLLFQRRSSLAAATIAIFLAGLGAGLWRHGQARRAQLDALLVKARRCAIAFESGELSALSGRREDLDTEAHARVKDRLARLQRVEPSVRLISLLRPDPASGRILLLADSRPPASPDLALPGDEYLPAAASSPSKLHAVIATGVPAAEGPLAGADGARIVGYAPTGRAGAAADLLALELVAADWHRQVWGAAFGTAAYVWMFLILPLVAFVSTRRQASQRDALRNLTEAMEQGHSAVVIVDLGGRIEYANTGFCRQLGYVRRELIGREWHEIDNLDSKPEVLTDIVATVRAGQPWTGEWIMRRKDGVPVPVRGGVTPVKDRTGKIRSFVAVFDDMTQVRQTEHLLREAKERAEAGDRAKGQFLATMSHEVRTPLNGIVGFASLLLDTELTPEQQEYVETIRTSSETLIQLTGDILDYARIESGRLKLEPQPCDPRECVENALDLVAAASVQKNIELLHWIEDGVPAAIVADVSRLRQVIVNLVNNAVKFTHDGEVEVRVRLVETTAAPAATADPTTTPAAPHCTLEFAVRDTGIGIAPEHHPKIFRPFSQVDDSTTRRYGGTGLGLAICKNIVELMNGTISFASEPARGSTFTFTIHVPYQLDDTTAPATPPPLQGRQLAVVARHAGLRDELGRLGTRLGARLVDFPPEALAGRTADWDVAIVDVSGPLAMELAALREPRPGLPPEKLIALAPIVLPGELRSALRTHFRLVLNKPLHHEMLRSLLVAPPPAATPPPAIAPAHGATEAGIAAPGQFDLRVLIVEDNAVNQRLIQRMISKLGCHWSIAADGRAALDELKRAVPDVVLMDLHMPEIDGLTAIGKIRAGEAGAAARDVWIIALTADARSEQKERTLSAGAQDYLTKPVHLPELTAALDRYLASRRLG